MAITEKQYLSQLGVMHETEGVPIAVTLDTLSSSVADRLLGLRGEGKEMLWVKTHADLIEDLRRRESGEVVEGYSYIRDGELLMTGLVRPQIEREKLEGIVKDAPFTTILHPGNDEVPTDQEGRKEYFSKKMRGVKKCVFVIGGLMENRLALEGIGVDIMKGMDKPEEVAIFVLSHSGAEKSYRDDADLSEVDSRMALTMIDASIQRIIKLTGFDDEEVVGLVGHSMGAFYVEKLANSRRYNKAAIVELAPLILGSRMSKNRNQWAEWLQDYIDHTIPHVKVQMGGLSLLINAALHAPDMAVRDWAIKKMGPSIAEHFVGKDAAHKVEAVAAITYELLRNKTAIIAQQRTLARMGMILNKVGNISDNPRFVVAAGKDDTLDVIHQRAWKTLLGIKLNTPVITQSETRAAMNSPHNPNAGSVKSFVAWLNDQIQLSDSQAVELEEAHGLMRAISESKKILGKI